MNHKLFMLDTNTSSYIIRSHPAVWAKLLAVPMDAVCVSAITEGELLYGIDINPSERRVELVSRFLEHIDILPWDSVAAQSYGNLRAHCRRQGTPLDGLDMLIAAHAVAAGAVLVSSDRAFYQVKFKNLSVVDWTVN